MYKVKQIADMLDVETVLIHEILINHRDVLGHCVIKKNSITYIDYDGYQKIKEIVKQHNSYQEKEVSTMNIPESVLHSDTVSNLDSQDLEQSKYHKDLQEIKSKITTIKQEINRIDILITREEEALTHYRKMLLNNIERA